MALLGCSSSGRGEVAITTWGEAYVEEEIPAGDFEDGWTVRYEKFLVVVGDVHLAGGVDADRRSVLETSVLVDLHAAGPHPLGVLVDVPEGPWSDVGYTTGPVTAATTVHASATASDLTLMQTGGYSVYVEGMAERGAVIKTFAWGFTTHTRYARCVDTGAAQPVNGIVVADGATVTAELTIHGDHLFYDDLQSPDAQRRFDHMAAADANDDGEVTLAELALVPLANIPPGEGSYGVGASDVDDLGSFVAASTRSLGHLNGEGHCAVERLD
jgi:hypothetical protein